MDILQTYYVLGQKAALTKLGAAPGSQMKSNLQSIGGLVGGGGIKPTGTPLSPGGMKNPLVGGGGIKSPKGLKPKSEPEMGATLSPIGSNVEPGYNLQNVMHPNAYERLSTDSLTSPLRRSVGNPL